MSYIKASVSKIQNCESVHVVKFKTQEITFTMVSLELDEQIQVGTKVKLAVKSTHISIAKEFSGITSTSNQLEVKVTDINNGKLLSSVTLGFLDTSLEAIITYEASKKMDLQIGDKVTALIKASDLAICEVLDGEQDD